MLLRRSKTLQEASKTLPRASKARKSTENQWCFNISRVGPTRFQEGFKTLHTASKTLQDAPRCPQDASKTPQDAPQDAPRRPKTPPRRPQDAPKTPQDASKTLRKAPKMLSSRAGLPKTAKSPKCKENQWFFNVFSVGPARFQGVLRGSKRHVFEGFRRFSDIFEDFPEDFVSIPRRRFYVLLLLLL